MNEIGRKGAFSSSSFLSFPEGKRLHREKGEKVLMMLTHRPTVSCKRGTGKEVKDSSDHSSCKGIEPSFPLFHILERDIDTLYMYIGTFGNYWSLSSQQNGL